MKATNLTISLKLAAVSAAMALGGVAYAASGTGTAPVDASSNQSVATQSAPAAAQQKDHSWGRKGEAHRHGHHRRGVKHDVAMWVPGYGPLNKTVVDSLDLTADQTKLLNEVKTEQKQSRKTRHDAMKTQRQTQIEQLKAGKMDPKAAMQASEKAGEQAIAARQDASQKWLKVWDALDTTQRQKVAAHFSERAEKFAQRSERHKEKRAEHIKNKDGATQSSPASAQS
ncbi:hypothetical protein [Pusillimonas sp. ANT_WB101]|uniref:hypothetical protein n=1 Tax=Pusillimonas sp. ANT_WB101 TaxID=2597356 RepID=UPI0011EE52BA|nr:hypothetical protein [Pusillimonas sp. ANT_WB101]KAA0910936.1 hypothetical protein FQ179_03510 [Pusillimonas sp. ANT_WB101]